MATAVRHSAEPASTRTADRPTDAAHAAQPGQPARLDQARADVGAPAAATPREGTSRAAASAAGSPPAPVGYPKLTVWQKWRRKRWWWWIGRSWVHTLALGYVSGYVLLAGWTFLPTLFGWTPVVIVTGSMAPSVRPGDVVLFERVAPAALGTGRLVLVDDPGHPGEALARRIYSRQPDGTLILKGDANAAPDPTPVRAVQVRGAARIVVPYVGRVTLWAENLRGVGLLWSVLTLAALALCKDPERRKRPGAPPQGAERRIVLESEAPPD